MKTICSLLMFMSLLTLSCVSKKSTTSVIETEHVESKEVMNKVDGNIINAKLTCEGKSAVSFLQLAEKKYDTEDFICKVIKSETLQIKFTSESKQMEMIFALNGIEEFNITAANYPCKSAVDEKYSTITLNAKSLGTHNFGDTFEGEVTITDYGMSSNVVCGKFNLKDLKGNRIEGTFNEIISTF